MPHSAALEPDIALAERLFAELRHETAQGKGIVRDSYGRGEQTAHAIAARAPAEIRLVTMRHAALNLYMTHPGRPLPAPVLLLPAPPHSLPHYVHHYAPAPLL